MDTNDHSLCGIKTAIETQRLVLVARSLTVLVAPVFFACGDGRLKIP